MKQTLIAKQIKDNEEQLGCIELSRNWNIWLQTELCRVCCLPFLHKAAQNIDMQAESIFLSYLNDIGPL